jgi:hypothetical protein
MKIDHSHSLAIAEQAQRLSVYLPPMINKPTSTDPFLFNEYIVYQARFLTGMVELDLMIQQFENDPKLLTKFQESIQKLTMLLNLNGRTYREEYERQHLQMILMGHSNRRADIMVISAAIGLVTCLGVLIRYQGALPGEAVGIISTIAGIFGSCLKDAYAFEFGSSRDSKSKNTPLA